MAKANQPGQKSQGRAKARANPAMGKEARAAQALGPRPQAKGGMRVAERSRKRKAKSQAKRRGVKSQRLRRIKRAGRAPWQEAKGLAASGCGSSWLALARPRRKSPDTAAFQALAGKRLRLPCGAIAASVATAREFRGMPAQALALKWRKAPWPPRLACAKGRQLPRRAKSAAWSQGRGAKSAGRWRRPGLRIKAWTAMLKSGQSGRPRGFSVHAL